MPNPKTYPCLENNMTSKVIYNGKLYHLIFEGNGLDYTCTVSELNYSRPWGFSSDMLSDEGIVKEALISKRFKNLHNSLKELQESVPYSYNPLP